MNGVQTRLKCKPNVKRCKRFVFAAHSPLLHPNTLKTKAIIHFQTDHILTRFVFPPLLNSNLSNHIVCLPYAFVSTKQMTNDAKNFWFPFCGSYRDFILKTTNQEKTYYDTNFTRFYMDMKDKSKVGHVVGQLKKIWEGRPVFIIEGRYSCLGIGNDLFDNAKSIRRIICPSQNAFSKYDEIFETATKIIPKDCLILSALGMTATVLCYDLSRRGYQAIDIGHIDIEYSWFRMRAKKKCSVPGKAVNEISNMPEKECSDNKYSESIVAVIQ